MNKSGNINLIVFIALMGTSALALASKSIVGGPIGSTFAYFLEVGVVAVFSVHLFRFFGHLLKKEEFIANLRNPTKSNLYSAMPIASALISIMLTTIGLPFYGQYAFPLSITFWALSLVFSIAFVVLIPIDLKFRSKVEHVLGTWFLPPVGIFVLVTAGSMLALNFGFMPNTISLLNLLLLGPAFVLYGLTLALVYFRSKFFPIETVTVAPTFNIVLAPVAVSIIAMLTTSKLLLASGVLGIAGLFAGISKTYSVILLGYGLWVLLGLPLLYYRIIKEHSKIHFSELWWALVFPLGAFTLAASSVQSFVNVWPLGAFCQLLYTLLFLLWGYVLIGYVKKRGFK